MNIAFKHIDLSSCDDFSLKGEKIHITLADMILQKQWKIIPYQERMLIKMESFCFTVKVTPLVGY